MLLICPIVILLILSPVLSCVQYCYYMLYSEWPIPVLNELAKGLLDTTIFYRTITMYVDSFVCELTSNGYAVIEEGGTLTTKSSGPAERHANITVCHRFKIGLLQVRLVFLSLPSSQNKKSTARFEICQHELRRNKAWLQRLRKGLGLCLTRKVSVYFATTSDGNCPMLQLLFQGMLRLRRKPVLSSKIPLKTFE